MLERVSACSRDELSRNVHRERNREYMRRWRASPDNRLKEITRRMRNNALRRQQRHENSLRNVCAFCHARLAIERVDRLVVKGNAFRVVNVPYCGQC